MNPKINLALEITLILNQTCAGNEILSDNGQHYYRGGQPTQELFTVILCNLNFAISQYFEAKITS